jgi:hypothetical protein
MCTALTGGAGHLLPVAREPVRTPGNELSRQETSCFGFSSEGGDVSIPLLVHSGPPCHKD